MTDCSICKGLEQALEARRTDYIEARSSAYFKVSTELAAYKKVEMERARINLEEHRLICVFATTVGLPRPDNKRESAGSTAQSTHVQF
jgi:hypothetical protein